MENFIIGFISGFVLTVGFMVTACWPKKPKRQRRERPE